MTCVSSSIVSSLLFNEFKSESLETMMKKQKPNAASMMIVAVRSKNSSCQEEGTRNDGHATT
ncbi:hypothetical protein GN958_ATG14863 [Phytophthora infestans]|uniref:Uncharacterized protein n=1 Tax=Phytophthora infestans TaxID=4787 RepID=A0A8S9U8T7_PHYIN|nr:hypothetical protein GN958_ATG14863 [Phytophthora infestans]